MNNWQRLMLAGSAFVLAVSINGSALAQQKVSTFTSKTMQFGAWSVRCEKENESPQTCVMTQTGFTPETKQKVFEVNIARTEVGTQMTLVLPLGVHLPKGIVLEVIDWDKKELPISFCSQAGCFVNEILNNEFVDLLRKKEKAQLTIWTTAAEKAIVPMSIDGFLDAYKEL